MTSTFSVPVVTIDQILPHPNADNLEIAHVLGWQMIVPKGEHRVGEKVTYFPIDTLLPQELSDRIGVTQYLSKQRIRCTRLRGEPSFGLVIRPDDPTWEVGRDVADHYGATRYEPPVRSSRSGGRLVEYPGALPEHPLFPRYTGIENMRHYPTVFEEGEEVVVTEKIHGTNTRVALIEGEGCMGGSHRVRRKDPVENLEEYADNLLYWYPWHLPEVERLLSFLGQSHRQVVLYGEVYGPSVQSFHYGVAQNKLGYRAFDLLLDGKYLDTHEFLWHCKEFEVPTVPVLYQGPFSLPTIRALSEGQTTLVGGGHMREGVVVRPLRERSHPALGGRVILKYVSDTYLLDRKRSDYTEV